MKISVNIGFIIILLIGTLQAQIALTVDCIDGISKQSLSGVEVFINEKIYKTDQSGKTVCKLSRQGIYDLIVYKSNYQVVSVPVQVNVDTTIQVSLLELTKTISTVEIQANHSKYAFVEHLKAVEGMAIYAGKKTEVVELDKLLVNKASNNARQIYCKVVGLNIYEGNEGGIQLHMGGRGLDPSRTSNFNTRQNGYDISADVLGYPESYYTPPAEGIESVQIVRGAASLQYGTQFGGLVNFKLKKPKSHGVQGSILQSVGSFGLVNTYSDLSYKNKRFSILGFYNYKRGSGFRPNAGYNAHYGYVYSALELTEHTKLQLEWTGMTYLMQQPGGLTDSKFNENIMYSNRSRNWFQVQWNLLDFKLKHRLTERTKCSLQLTGLLASRNALGFRGNVLNLNSNPITDLDEQIDEDTYVNPRDLIKGSFKNIGIEGRILSRYSLRKIWQTWVLGFKIYNARNRSQQGPGSNKSDPDFSFYNQQFFDYPNQSTYLYPNKNVALFAEHIFRLGAKWSVTPGIRLEYILTEAKGKYVSKIYDIAGNVIDSEQVKEVRALPRFFPIFGVGINYALGQEMKCYANISQNYRSVTFSDIQVVNPSFKIDPSITDESGYTLDIGLRGSKKHWQFDTNLFGILYNNRIGIILDDRANRVRKNIGSAGMVGVESIVEYNWLANRSNADSDLITYINGAYTYARYISSEENNVVGKNVEFIPAWNIKTGITGRYQNWRFGTQGTFLAKQYTDVQNAEVPVEGDPREGLVGPIPAYYVVDFNMGYSVGAWSFQTGVENLLNRKYFTRRATGYPGPGIIPSGGRSFYLTIGYKFGQN